MSRTMWAHEFRELWRVTGKPNAGGQFLKELGIVTLFVLATRLYSSRESRQASANEWPQSPLLAPEGHHRIDLRRAASWKPAGQSGNAYQQECYH